MNTNQEILSYARGSLNGGGAIDAATREYMKEKGEKSYSAAQRAVIANAKAEEAKAEAARAKDRREFMGRKAAYKAEFHLNDAEAERRVAKDDPRMRKVYESDPMAASTLVGVAEPPAVAGITIAPWTPVVHETPALTRFANIIFGLPRDPYNLIELAQVVESMRPYPDLPREASGDKMDTAARAEISILGLTGFSSANYRIGFQSAAKRYPALFALYSAGRWSSQAIREMLPQVQIYD